MDKIKNLMVLGMFVVGCGAAEEEGYEEDQTEVGSIEQPFHGKRTPSFQYGTRTATSRQKCDRTSAGQVCAIPPSKTLSYCIDPTNIMFGVQFTTAERVRISTAFEGLDGGTDFTLNPVDTFGFSCTGVTAQIKVFPGAAGSSGTASNNVKDYVHTPMFDMTSLIEGAGIVGSYQAWGGCQINIDRVDINAKGTSSTQDNNGIDHAALHGLLACLGIGGQGGLAGRASRNLFDPSTTAVNVSQGEACQILGFTLSSPGQFNNSLTGDCASD